MKTYSFQTNFEQAIENALHTLKKAPFNTHEFIQHFSQGNQEVYILELFKYKEKQPFQTVHAKIGKFLSDKSTKKELIKATGRTSDSDIFGTTTVIEKWDFI